MSLFQTIKLVLSNIKSNKLRSFLTMLGIIIGVAAVIIMVSMMQGLIDSQMDFYGKIGINNINVTIRGKGVNKLSSEDIYKFAEDNGNLIMGVTQTTNMKSMPNFKKGNQIIDDNYYVTAIGVDEYYFRLLGRKITAGRGINYSDVATRKKVCVIGTYISKKLFKYKTFVGDTIYIDGIAYEVIGILDEIQGAYKYGADNAVYMPNSTVERMIPPENANGYDPDEDDKSAESITKSYQFVGKNALTVSEASNIIRDFLNKKIGNNKLYSISDMTSTLGEVQKIKTQFSLAAGGIGAISLFVAGIGIMNIMLVSVTERTREIGIRKSLGAKKRDIRRQFILEAGITGGVGGIIGILLGIGGLILFKLALNLKASANIVTILISFGVSVGIGMIFGFLPANKAANLNPIDALRSE